MPGARFSPAFLEAVAAWATVQQQRRLSPAQRLATPPPPPPPPRPPPVPVPQRPTAPASPSADASTMAAVGSIGNAAEEPDAQSPQKLSDADAPASVGSAASVMSQQAADGAEGPEQDAAVEAGQSPVGAADGSPWEDYSSAAWIAEALTGLQVSDDAERGPDDAPAAEAVVRASGGSSSVEAATSVRGGAVRPSTSGDDSDEVTSPFMHLPGLYAAQLAESNCPNAFSTWTHENRCPAYTHSATAVQSHEDCPAFS